jgi:hypothetical protein
VDLGCWLNPSHRLGFEASYLGIGTQTTQFQADTDSFPILARPFFNIQSGNQGQDADLVSFPGVVRGSLTITGTTQFQAIDALVRGRVLDNQDLSIDCLLGYRFGQLKDSLVINEFTTAINPQGPALVGTTFQVFDVFDTENHFNGGTVGVELQDRCGRWSTDILLKLAMGSTHSRAAIGGTTTTTVPGTRAVTYTGGILAQPTNIGTYDQNFFSLIPELGVNIGYDLTDRLRVSCGYTIVYWSKVARPGDQIDTELNATQFPPGTLVGAPRPQFVLRTTDFWAQGLNVGLAYRF